MNEEIDITELNKAEVLVALYNASKQQGMGFLQTRGQHDLTIPEAEELITARTYVDHNGNKIIYFDYLHGRVMKVNLADNILYTGLYDRDNGPNAALTALTPLLK